MATSYKTPGVFVEEIPKFPPSIAQVETAIPAFVGFTEFAASNGTSLINVPTKITSLLEYTTYFGGPLVPKAIEVKVNPGNNYAVDSVMIDSGNRYYLYDSVRLFYDNGGGDCYIVSVGGYLSTTGTVQAIAPGEEANPLTKPGLRVGLAALEKEDEPTILLFPDAVSMADDASLTSLQQMAIMQAMKLQDRFALLDLKDNGGATFASVVSNFRSNIGMVGLKYSAAYGPWLYTSFTKDVDYALFSGSVRDSTNADNTKNLIDLATTTADPTANALIGSMATATKDADSAMSTIKTILSAKPDGSLGMAADAAVSPTVRDRFKVFANAVNTDAAPKTALKTLITFVNNAATALRSTWTGTSFFGSAQMTNDVASYGSSESLWRGSVKGLIGTGINTSVLTLTGGTAKAITDLYALTGNPWLGIDPTTIAATNAYTVVGDRPQAQQAAAELAVAFEKLASFTDTIIAAAASYKKAAQDALYEKHPVVGNIVRSIRRELNKLPPSGAVAGVYARVDSTRGVWKAPANESLISVTGPTYAISEDEQAGLNVDAVAGKSINAIRAFTGKGTRIWGARTLAGNDNEWRYVSVRRFFNMVEESTRKSTEQFVFESNDANTWVKVQGMIENFLTTLWKQGALQGAKPEHAFYCAVGLGKTMTALDILEGRMIVEIGMAVVRPAEFIILRFSHKMAES